ncbi:MAG: hypothetical protein ACOCU7_06430 [Tangfeifania sp.]
MKLTYKRTWLFGVLIACPLHKPLKSCPFSYLRNNPRKIQLEYIKSLPDTEVESLIRYHKNCILQRISNRLAMEKF